MQLHKRICAMDCVELFKIVYWKRSVDGYFVKKFVVHAFINCTNYFVRRV